jgi:hypothetical protein
MNRVADTCIAGGIFSSSLQLTVLTPWTEKAKTHQPVGGGPQLQNSLPFFTWQVISSPNTWGIKKLASLFGTKHKLLLIVCLIVNNLVGCSSMDGACHYLQTAIGECEAYAIPFFKSHLPEAAAHDLTPPWQKVVLPAGQHTRDKCRLTTVSLPSWCRCACMLIRRLHDAG